MTSYFNQKNIGNIQLGLRSATNTFNQSARNLASGQRVNSSFDDATDLALANKLRSEVRQNAQGVRNINDGVSVANLAFSAIEELTKITSRISELATQAANGLYTDSQRGTLDIEAQALVSEYSRVAASTAFNGDSLFVEDKEIDIFFGSQTETETLAIGNLLGTTTITGGGGGGTAEVTDVDLGGLWVVQPPGPGLSFRIYQDTNIANSFYVWFNNGAQTDPGHTGTAIEVDSSSGDTTVIAGLTATAIGARPEFSATSSAAVVTITNAATGDVTDAANIDTSFTITTTTQGAAGGGGGETTEYSTTIDGIDLSTQSAAQSSIDAATSKISSLSVANGKLNANMAALNSNYNRYSQNELNLTEAVNKITSVDVASETANFIEGQIRQQSVTELTKTNNLQAESILGLLS